MNARRGPRKGVAGLPTAPLHTHQGSPGLLSGSACAPGLDDVAAQALEQPAWWPRLAALAVQDASGTPWAGYWQARARLLAEPAQARQGLLAAHAVAAKARELGAAHLQFSVELLASRAQAARERTRRRFAQALSTAAQRLAEAGPPARGAATPLLQRALEADPLSEPVARALILLHLAQGQAHDARRVWRQTQALMQLAGGLGTSESLLALAHQHGL